MGDSLQNSFKRAEVATSHPVIGVEVETPAIYIEWCDAIADNSRWMSLQEAKDWGNNEDWIIKQVGFLLVETDEYLLLANKINPHRDTEVDLKVDSLLKLPKTWIRKRVNLAEVIAS